MIAGVTILLAVGLLLIIFPRRWNFDSNGGRMRISFVCKKAEQSAPPLALRITGGVFIYAAVILFGIWFYK